MFAGLDAVAGIAAYFLSGGGKWLHVSNEVL